MAVVYHIHIQSIDLQNTEFDGCVGYVCNLCKQLVLSEFEIRI